MHQGLTSSDILDTTLAVQLNDSCAIILDDLNHLRSAVAKRAREFKYVPMIGRSHGIHAEPITFGLKLALMYDEFARATQRLLQMRERIRVGKLSGAVGTHAHLDPAVEAAVCKRLGLAPAALSTQVLQRDRHAEFMTVMALIDSSIDRWATEFRHLQRTEVLEVEEFFAQGQKGSSAMPHKRNPITGERLSGLARDIRGNAMAALENVPLWNANAHAKYGYTPLAGYDGFIRADGQYVGESYPDFMRTDPATFQRAYALLDLRNAILHEAWEADLFVTNVFDKQAALSDFISGNYSASTRTRMYTNQPRTIGASLHWKF